MVYSDKEKAKEASKERVRRYREKAKGVTRKEDVTPSDVTPLGKLYVYGEGGGKISLEKLIDPGWRGLFIYLKEHLREDYKGSVRVGVDGVTVKELDRLVEITA